MIISLIVAGALSAPASLWTEGGYSNHNLDVFDFGERVSKTTKFIDERAFRIGGRWEVNADWYGKAEYGTRRVRAERAREPFNFTLRHSSVLIGIERWVPDAESKAPSWHFSLNYGNFPRQTLDRYQVGERVIGEDIVFFDPVTLESYSLYEYSMQTYGARISHSGAIGVGDLYWHADYEFTFVDAQGSSVLDRIEDPELLAISFEGRTVEEWLIYVASRVPQSEPWQEHNLSVGVLHSYKLNERWTFDNKLTADVVYLSDYNSQVDTSHFNLSLESRVACKVTQSVELYGSAYLGSNYTLGLYPGTYTQQSAFLFEHPYLLLRVGAEFVF